MASIFPFAALRPAPQAAAAVAAVPYDVVTTDEARALASGYPLSFLHVSRAEIDLPPGTDPHSDPVYERAAENFADLRARAPLVEEETPMLYVYRLQMGSHTQTGIAACFSLDEYDQGLIKKHEKTTARQGRRPHASHAGDQRANWSGVAHLSRIERHRRPRRTHGRRKPAVRLQGAGRGAPYLVDRRREQMPTRSSRRSNRFPLSTLPMATIVPPAPRERDVPSTVAAPVSTTGSWPSPSPTIRCRSFRITESSRISMA